jgi:hypothetical protein
MPIYPADGTTLDPSTQIVARRNVGKPSQRLEYQNWDGDRWYIAGLCNACGACEVNGDGSLRAGVTRVAGKTIGQAGAVVEAGYATRLDIPIRPELTTDSPGCVLTGAYITRGG